MPENWNNLTLQNKHYSFSVLVNYGAALSSYKFQEMEFVDGYSSVKQIKKEKYKGVLLAPFPNRTAAAKYSFQGQHYQLKINREKEKLALHGLLYDQKFEVLNQTLTRLELKHEYLGDKQGYPFPFEIKIIYVLDANGRLTCTAKILNTGDLDLPFGLGWHPYFKIGDSIDDLELVLPKTNQLDLSDKLLPTGKEKLFSESGKFLNLRDYHFDDCFALQDGGKNSFVLNNKKVKLEISSGDSFPFYQIYTPTNRKSVAIEPMSCPPNALNTGNSLLVIPKKEERIFTYSLLATTHNF